MNCTNALDQQPIHLNLPIAPQANHRPESADDEKMVNAMLPVEAVAWIRELAKGGKTFKTIELCGPGDCLASSQASFTTLELLQGKVNNADLSLTCLGLKAAGYADELLHLGITQVNLLIDTIKPDTVAKLYKWVRPGKKNVPLTTIAPQLIADQAAAVKSFSDAGIRVVLRSTIYPGVNDTEIPLIAETMAALGARSMEINTTSISSLDQLISETAKYLPTSKFSKQCDLLPPGNPRDCQSLSLPEPDSKRPNVAVASSNGMDVDLHLGQAGKLLIYGPRDDDGLPCLLETRATPPGGVSRRWQNMADDLTDCFVLLASHAGDTPRQVLSEQGIKVILTDDNVEGLVDALYDGGKKKKCK